MRANPYRYGHKVSRGRLRHACRLLSQGIGRRAAREPAHRFLYVVGRVLQRDVQPGNLGYKVRLFNPA
uniref:Uncharacterized protein n=1 Tax=Siphoviridae sp. ctzyE57 TaxID=2827982 RepID=A0A8S5SHK1_9CAUD|nr:MAG TPA: hypothetical protein [Siphoviridae sp. ctzyE57]